MKDFNNWEELSKGFYRYVIGANVCYEIHILCHYKDTDILTANSNLYIVGDWRSESGQNFFERELLMREQPVFECIEKAVYDNEKNNS